MSNDYEVNKVAFNKFVQDAIDEVLQSTDPLDSADFNCVGYINQLFPNEQSLSNIDDIISKMECEISLIDDNIRNVVRGQTNTGQDGRIALEEAQNVIKELFSQISDIKNRAEKTEDMVKEITRDIKQLDCAKKNLTTAITALNHLHMFVGGVETLNNLIARRLYGEILNPLQAVSEVNQHFQQYSDIPQIMNLSKQMQEIHLKLVEQITEDFQNTFSPNVGSTKMSTTQLTEACKVASVLDHKIKRDLIKWFLNLQLEEYVQLFHENQDIAWLDKIDKRYGWLKRHLLDFEEKFGHVFPPDWEVSERMAVQFCTLTQDGLSKVMKKRRSEIDVKLLLYAICKTQNFEQLLSKRFTGVTLVSNGSRSAIKDGDSTSMPFTNLICCCFEPYFEIYTEHVDRNLSELIERFVQFHKQPFNPAEGQSTVFPSCADLFVFYKKCIVQCTQLNNSKAIFDMAMLFKKYLREYAVKVLEMSIPKFSTSHSSIGSSMSLLTKDLQNLSTAAGQVIHNLLKEGEAPRFTLEELVRTCCVLTTAEYCLETVQQLEDKLKEKVENSFSDKIDLSEEKDIFHRIISNSIQLLVQDVENGCEPALNVMSKMQWQLIGCVGDQSAFVNSIILHFKQTIPAIRDNLSTSRKYYTQFCHKFVNSFIPKYINTLLKCRPNNSSDGTSSILGCEQMLLDTHSLKTVLLELPSISSNVNRKAPTSYTKAVIKGMTRAEMIIKVVMAPIIPITVFNEQIFKLLPDVTLSEYQKILDMKGVKKIDQLQLIELFKKSSNNETTTNIVNISRNSLDISKIEKTTPYGSKTYESPDTNSDRRRIKKLENLIKQRL